MARKYILAGESLGTERPKLDKRFDNLSNISVDFGGETELVSLAYDTRNQHPVTGNPILWLAGESNKRIYACDSKTMQVIESFPFPTTGNPDITPTTKCYGLAILSDPTTSTLVFLSEPGLDTTTCPLLFHLKYVPAADTPEGRLVVTDWFYVNTTGAAGVFQLSVTNRGMSDYKGNLMILGKYNDINTIAYIDRNGMILAVYPTFEAIDDLRGVVHIHDRVYTTMDGTTDARIGGRYLAKFLSDEIDNVPGRMIPLPSIEPFFIHNFFGDMTIYQDRMASCDRDRVYLYKMLYFCFIVDNMHMENIDMGSILIGDYKVKMIKLKNIADYYKIKDVNIIKTAVTCAAGESACPASEAVGWVKFALVDPALTVDPSIWTDTILLAETSPYLAPDGEQEFWVKIDVPVTYTNLTTVGGTPRPVDVDDGPFVVPLEITAKVG